MEGPIAIAAPKLELGAKTHERTKTGKALVEKPRVQPSHSKRVSGDVKYKSAREALEPKYRPKCLPDSTSTVLVTHC